MTEDKRGDFKLTPVDFDPFADGAVANVLPLTEPQAEIWAEVQMGDEASCAYNLCFSLTLRGLLSAKSMESALRQVMDRHDGLRVSISADGDYQQIAPSSQIALPVIDLSHHPVRSRAAEIGRILGAETMQPFDLPKGPLLRATIVREAADLHRLIVTVHHIVCDGWSLAVLFSDLGRLYVADRQELSAQLPPRSPYRDYITREAARGSDAEARGDEDYWAQQYADSIPVLELPLDHPRGGVKTYNAECRKLRLEEPLCRALKKVGTQFGCTLFVTLLAGFEALISRLTGQADIVVGIPMAGQALLDNSHLVAHCVNLIPLRGRMEQSSRFVDHLKNVRSAFLEAQSHQRRTFGSLVRRLKVPRDANRTPLVSVTFNLDKIGAPFDFGDLSLESVEIPPKRFVNFEFSISVVDNGRDLLIECEYNSDLFLSATIVRWLAHYRVLLEAIISKPEQRINELPLLTAAERHQLLVQWNDTATDYPADALIHNLFEAQVARTPDAVAVVSDGRTLSYGGLDRRANQLAHALRKRGVGPDVLVGLCVNRTPDMIVALLGIFKAGGAYVPLDPEYPADRLAFMLEDCGAKVLITEESLRASLPPLPAVSEVIYLDTDAGAHGTEREDEPRSEVDPSNLAYAIYTSGSTGQPKAALLSHRGLCNLAVSEIRLYGIGPQSRVLQSASLSFDTSLSEIAMALCSGATLYVEARDTILPGPALERYLDQEKISVLSLTPSALAMLDPTAAPSVEQIIVGGEPCSAELAARWAGRCRFFNAYGPTETTITATYVEYRDGALPPLIGRPLPNVRVYLLDQALEPVPVGVTGELYIGGIGVARGYLNRPQLNAERFLPDPFCDRSGAHMYRSGDFARWRSDGQIDFIGRIDDQVKIRGFRIELGEIEAVLAEHPDVRQAAVHLWTVKADDARIVACCVPAKAGVLAPISLRKHLRARLPEYMVPQYFLPVDEIPLTPNGKVDRRRLPTPVVAESGIGRHEAPSDPIEATIAEIWTQLIHPARPIGRIDKFFEMGGHSLLGIKALRQIENKLGVRIEFRMLFQESLADIATRCRSERIAGEGRHGGAARPVALPANAEVLPSENQERI